MPWFRIRKKKSSDDQRSSDELEAKPEPTLTDSAAGAADTEPTDPTKPKRRRGSRGGRGRKKPGTSAAGAGAPERKGSARKEKGEPAKQPQRRELSQRQERRRDQSTLNA